MKKRVVIIGLMFLSIGIRAMERNEKICNEDLPKILLSADMLAGKAYSAAAHMALALGLAAPEKTVVISKVEHVNDTLSLPETIVPISYLDTMQDGGNKAQLDATKQKVKSEMRVLGVLLNTPQLHLVKEDFKSYEMEENQAFYVVILKKEENPLHIISNRAIGLGNMMKDLRKNILAMYEDISGSVVSVASKYPFIVMTAKKSEDIESLMSSLKQKGYSYFGDKFGVAFFNKNKHDKSLTKKFSIAKN